MKKVLFTICLLIVLAVFSTTVGAQDTAQWTVMLYLCGTDLESEAGCATSNLVEVAKTIPNKLVNFVIQTGGTKAWAAEDELGLQISTEVIQRYSYDENGFTLVDEQPNADMSRGTTLTDFIRWSAERYPAEKYTLVLWDHGGGPASGMIWDEIYNNESLSLAELGDALNNAETHLEALVMDACLMSSLETAIQVAPYANYLIASEETVSGGGSNYSEWLQYLYDRPDCDGLHFGRSFCDSMQQKYSGYLDDSAQLTFSVIDLNAIDRVAQAFNNLMYEAALLLPSPEAFSDFTYAVSKTDHFGSNLFDLGNFAKNARKGGISGELVNELEDAIQDAVPYQIKGASHAYSTGMSFYYDLSGGANLDYYQDQTITAPYLAMQDAIHPDWEAPDWVYDNTDRLPEVDPMDYQVSTETSISEDGEHLILNINNAEVAVRRVDYLLSSVDEENHRLLFLGNSHDVVGDFATGEFMDDFNGIWPTINGKTCSTLIFDELPSVTLYHIPMIYSNYLPDMDPEKYRENFELIRAVFFPVDEEGNEMTDESAANQDSTIPIEGYYQIFGVWKGYDDATGLPDRNTTPITNLNGRKATLFFPIVVDPNSPEYAANLTPGEEFTFNDELDMYEDTLPDGTYMMNFAVTDIFGNEIVTTPQFFTLTEGIASFLSNEESEAMAESFYSSEE